MAHFAALSAEQKFKTSLLAKIIFDELFVELVS